MEPRIVPRVRAAVVNMERLRVARRLIYDAHLNATHLLEDRHLDALRSAATMLDDVDNALARFVSGRAR